MNPILRALKKVFLFIFLTALFCGTRIISYGQAIDFGKSYINVTKGLNGGTVETGDTLEIRASFVVRSGTFDSCSYTDAIPVGTTYIPSTIRVLTNEGKIYKQFTDVITDDCGWITGSTIRINLGFNPAAAPATVSRRGRVANTHKPSFFLGTCIMIASFRVRVTAALGSNISSGGGSMTYKNGVSPIVTFIFPANTIRVYQNFAICANTVGVNSIGTESNGTFSNGRPRNRGTSANVPAGYTYAVFTTGGPNDYFYGVANNTSARTQYTTLNTWPKPDPDPDGGGPLTTHRVFGVWDIIGDHTGAVSPTLGNPAADTVANPNAGYMLVVNAAYRIDSAFQQTISNLCPNTYYEISCWMRNICSKCGCDSNGKGASDNSGPPFYIPTAVTDSSGVYPNITFDIDGVDYYSTGNILYKGIWVKKGFTFLTGPTQTSFTLKFFNNAPGGGGNDWALDDISVATCSPNMKYSPSINPNVCRGNALTLFDTVRSFFNNYTYYKWQRSTDNGATWLDVTPASGPAAPVWNGTAWQYVTTYTVPPANTQFSDSADQYRMVVATTASNLSNSNCRFTDNGNIITIHIIDCGPPLGIQMMSFSGRREDDNSVLSWTTAREPQPVFYDIERSTDGSTFTLVATVNSMNNTNELNTYSYTDPAPQGVIYYRIKLRNSADQFAYTRTILLSSRPTKLSFSVLNPFSEQLRFDVTSVRNARIDVALVDASGQVRRRASFALLQGTNRLNLINTDDLPTGIYILQIQSEGVVLQKTVLKQIN